MPAFEKHFILARLDELCDNRNFVLDNKIVRKHVTNLYLWIYKFHLLHVNCTSSAATIHEPLLSSLFYGTVFLPTLRHIKSCVSVLGEKIISASTDSTFQLKICIRKGNSSAFSHWVKWDGYCWRRTGYWTRICSWRRLLSARIGRLQCWRHASVWPTYWWISTQISARVCVWMFACMFSI
jgi:hypothetical protein